MPETVTVAKAKEQLCEPLRRASDGERFTVTNRGRPVAEIGPPGRPDVERVAAAIERIRERRKGRALGGDRWKDLVSEGRP